MCDTSGTEAAEMPTKTSLAKAHLSPEPRNAQTRTSDVMVTIRGTWSQNARRARQRLSPYSAPILRPQYKAQFLLPVTAASSLYNHDFPELITIFPQTICDISCILIVINHFVSSDRC